jgi:tetratricopeptide (TPR) repeat protein
LSICYLVYKGVLNFNCNFNRNQTTPNSLNEANILSPTLREKNLKMIAQFTEAINLDANNAGALTNRGIAKQELGQYKEAIEDFDQAIKVAKTFKDKELAYYNMGITHTAMAMFPEAIADYDEALKLDNQDFEAYLNRGAMKANLSQHFEAAKDFGEAIKLRPDDPKPYIWRAYSSLQYGFPKQALNDLTKAENLSPEFKNSADAQAMRQALMKQLEK